MANTFRLRNHMAWIWRQQRPKSAMFLATLRLLKHSIGIEQGMVEKTEYGVTESRSTESRSTESRSTESRSTESRSTESRSTESRSTESQSTESRSTESRSTEFIYVLPPSVLPWTNLHVLWLWKSTKTRYCYS